MGILLPGAAARSFLQAFANTELSLQMCCSGPAHLTYHPPPHPGESSTLFLYLPSDVQLYSTSGVKKAKEEDVQ